MEGLRSPQSLALAFSAWEMVPDYVLAVCVCAGLARRRCTLNKRAYAIIAPLAMALDTVHLTHIHSTCILSIHVVSCRMHTCSSHACSAPQRYSYNMEEEERYNYAQNETKNNQLDGQALSYMHGKQSDCSSYNNNYISM